jgi:hypothetical protein
VIRAVGDSALVWRKGGLRLLGPRGCIARWDGTQRGVVLADPPRLAVQPKSLTSIEIVDVGTGERQRAVYGEQISALVGFSPNGADLFCVGRRGLVRIDDAGGAYSVVAGRECSDLAFDPLGEVAVAAVGGLLCVVVQQGRVRWQTAAFDRVLGISGDGSLVATIGDDCRQLIVRRMASGDLVVQRTVRSAPIGLVAAYSDSGFTRISLLTVDGHITRLEHDGDRLQLAGDVDAGFIADTAKTAAKRAPRRGRIRSSAGMVLFDDDDNATFAGTGVAVVLREGRVLAFVGDEARPVEGPTNLVSITPHPRGVLAVDDEERAHVLAIDDDVREVSS